MKTVKQFKKFEENPAQWAGETLDHNLFHIKYEDGMLIVSIDQSKMILDYGRMVDCVMETGTMQYLTRGILAW